jgi:hypothetical protein
MIKLRYAVLALTAAMSLAACAAGGGTKNGDNDDDEWDSTSGGGGALFDLDSADALWLAQKSGKWLVLFTYKGDAWVSIDVRGTPKGAIEGQYTGSRLGTVAEGYTLEFDCLNPGISPVCEQLGTTMTLSCTSAMGPQLVCGSMVFNKVTSADIAQE